MSNLPDIESVKTDIVENEADESRAKVNWEKAEREGRVIYDSATTSLISLWVALIQRSNILHAKLARQKISTPGQFLRTYSELHYVWPNILEVYCCNQPYVCLCTRAQP